MGATQSSSPLARPIWGAAFFVLLAFLLYGNTLSHKYAQDDAIVITQNDYTKAGFKGISKIFTSDAFEAFFKGKRDLVAGGRYRPLSIATFAAEVELFGLNPAVSHFVNVLLYGLLGVVLFFALRSLVAEPSGRPWWSSFAFLATLLFMVHPVHTEVVANIKGRDELLAMLLVMVSLWAALQYAEFRRPADLVWCGLSFFFAALSKETALPFLAIIPLSLWVQGKAKRSAYLASVGVIGLATAAYLGLRLNFGGGFGEGTTNEILNDPFVHATYMEQLATAAKTFGLYLGKLFAPVTLTHDYYYNQVPVVGWGDPLALVSLVVGLGLLGYGIWAVRKRSLVGYGILFFFLSFSIVSNAILPIGVTMGERFLFVPSLGFAIALVALLPKVAERVKMPSPKLALAVVGIVGIIFAARTIARNPVWYDDFTLFTTDVENSPNSAKVQTAAGGALVDAANEPKNSAKKDAYLQRAIKHLRRAVEIYPEHGNAWFILGNAYYNSKDYANALVAYKNAIALRNIKEAYKNAPLAALQLKQYDVAESYYVEAEKLYPKDISVWMGRGDNFELWGKPTEALGAYQKAASLDPKNHEPIGKMGMIYGKYFQDFDKAIQYLNQAIALKPNEESHYENLGIAYAMKGNPQQALETFNKGLAHFPNSQKLLRNVGITYMNLGDTAKAQEYFRRSGG